MSFVIKRLITFVEDQYLKIRSNKYNNHYLVEVLLENTKTGLIESNSNGKILYANTFAAEIFNIPLKALLKTDFHLLFSSNNSNDSIQIDRVLNNEVGKIYGEKRIVRDDGSTIWVDFSVLPIKKKFFKKTRFLTILRNITEKIISEKQKKNIHDLLETKVLERTNELEITLSQLRSSEERFVKLLESMNDVVYTLNKNFELTGVFGEWSEVSSDVKENMVSIFLGDNFSNEKKMEYHDMLERVLSGDSEIFKFSALNFEQYEYFFESSFSPRKNMDNEIIGIIGIARNITKNRALEKQTEIALKEAAEANRLQSEFLTNISHEIRTPLNAVIGFSELLSSLITDPKQIAYVKSIKASGKTLLQLINDILDLSKIEAGKMILNKTIVNFCDLFNDLSALFDSKKREGNNVLIFEHNNVPHILTDEIHLRQILINLIGNALKFTSNGTVKVVASISRNITDGTAQLNVSVADTGIGIPKEQLDTIFEMFVQQEGQANQKYGGSGLGLSISKKLAKIMKGDIFVKSSIHTGSEFTLILPEIQIAPDFNPSSPLLETINPHSLLKGKKILIVDDDDANRTLLKEFLEYAEMLVLDAPNGKVGIEMFKSHHPDIIIMDIRMPIMNGYEATRQIKATPEGAIVPIVAYTANVDITEEIHSELFHKTLSKPSSPTDVLQTLSYLLGSSNYFISRQVDETIERNQTIMNKVKLRYEIFAEYETHILPQLKRFSTEVVLIKHVRDVANRLTETGNSLNSPELLLFGEGLKSAADAFDMGKIKKVSSEIYEFLSNSMNL